MFQLNVYDAVWEWRNIFFLLSMDSCDILWDTLELPVEVTPVLKNIARGFVNGFAQMSISFWLQPLITEQVRQLFQSTYDDMIISLGEQATESICTWGNKLITLLESNMFLWWEELFEPLIEEKNNDNTLIELGMSPKKLQDLKMTLKQVKREIRTFDDRLVAVEATRRSRWDDYVDRLYTKGDIEALPKDGDRLISPRDLLPMYVALLKGSALWNLLNTILTSDELQILAGWAQAQAKKRDIAPDKVKLPDLSSIL